jgi:hypothetical protein
MTLMGEFLIKNPPQAGARGIGKKMSEIPKENFTGSNSWDTGLQGRL